MDFQFCAAAVVLPQKKRITLWDTSYIYFFPFMDHQFCGTVPHRHNEHPALRPLLFGLENSPVNLVFESHITFFPVLYLSHVYLAHSFIIWLLRLAACLDEQSQRLQFIRAMFIWQPLWRGFAGGCNRAWHAWTRQVSSALQCLKHHGNPHTWEDVDRCTSCKNNCL